MKNPFLVGPSLYLRPIDHADAPLTTRWTNDPAIKRSLGTHRPLTLEQEEARIEATNKDDHEIVLGIVRQEDDRLIGLTGLHKIDFKNRNAMFGIVIGEAEEWGKGLGTEAARLVVGHGFSSVNLHRLWVHVNEDNARGIGVLERVGFTREGVLRQAAYRDGRYWDLVMMGVLREEHARPA